MIRVANSKRTRFLIEERRAVLNTIKAQFLLHVLLTLNVVLSQLKTSMSFDPGSLGGLSYTPFTSVSRISSCALISIATRDASESLSEKLLPNVWYPWLADTASFSLSSGTMPSASSWEITYCTFLRLSGDVKSNAVTSNCDVVMSNCVNMVSYKLIKPSCAVSMTKLQ